MKHFRIIQADEFIKADNSIVRLRRCLEDEPNNPKILQTVRGVGYRFVADDKN